MLLKTRGFEPKQDMPDHLGLLHLHMRCLFWGYGFYLSRDTKYIPSKYLCNKDFRKTMLCLASEQSKTSLAPQYAPPRTYVEYPLVVERFYLQKIKAAHANLQ